MLVIGSFGKDRARGDHLGTAEPAVLKTVRAYWEGLRVEGGLPARDMIDPRGLASALEQVFLLERIAPGHARFRLAGNLFHDLMGMDVRGMPFSAPFEPAARQRLQPVLDEVFTGSQALHLTLDAERGIGGPALAARVLLLPLQVRPDEPGMALGILAQDGAIGRAPRRFHIATARLEALLRPETREVLVRKGDLTPSYVANPPVHPARTPKQEPASLRLVHSRE